MMQRLRNAFIMWAVRRCRNDYRRWFNIVAWSEPRVFAAKRFLILWQDEYWARDKWHYRRPWYLPFNAFVHWWRPEEVQEPMHDHARWSITVVLRGRAWEKTPKDTRLLLPGTVVFRSHRAIHNIEVAPRWRGKTWTLFIVGRKNHQQNTYQVTPVRV